MSYDLPEHTIRNAIRNSTSAKGCARFLNISYDTFKKYAKRYVDSETGLNLLEYAKKYTQPVPKKPGWQRGTEEAFKRILSGEVRNFYTHGVLKKKLLFYGCLEEKCSACGYNQARIDFEKPLIIDWIDGNPQNGRLDNLRWLCYNCYFQMVGDLKIVRRTYQLTPEQEKFFEINEIERNL